MRLSPITNNRYYRCEIESIPADAESNLSAHAAFGVKSYGTTSAKASDIALVVRAERIRESC